MNNLSLESRSWNAFFIEDIAEITSVPLKRDGY